MNTYAQSGATRPIGWPVILVHWLVLLLVVGLFTIGWTRDLIEDHDLKRTLTDVHRLIGLVVAALVFVRILLRVRMGPHADAELPPLLRWGSLASQAVMYGLLVGLPIIGLMQTGAAKAHPTLFGIIPLPSLVAHNRPLAETLAGLHSNISWVLLALIGLHALAALWHHYGRRDGVLLAMLGRGRSSLA